MASSWSPNSQLYPSQINRTENLCGLTRICKAKHVFGFFFFLRKHKILIWGVMGWHMVMSLYSWYVWGGARVVYFSPEILGSTTDKTRIFSWAYFPPSVHSCSRILVSSQAECRLGCWEDGDGWDVGVGMEGDLRTDYCGSDGRKQETACLWGLHISGLIFWLSIKLGDYDEGGKTVVQGWNQFRILSYCFSDQFGQWWLTV